MLLIEMLISLYCVCRRATLGRGPNSVPTEHPAQLHFSLLTANALDPAISGVRLSSLSEGRIALEKHPVRPAAIWSTYFSACSKQRQATEPANSSYERARQMHQ